VRWGAAAAALAVAAGAGLLARALAAPRVAAVPGAELLPHVLPPHARQHAAAIVRAARAHGLDPLLLAAVLEQESNYGQALTPRGPGGKGDAGHGHGVGQIDDRTWGAWLKASRWWDFEVNATKAAEILAAGLKAFPGQLRPGLASYNAGPARVRAALSRGKDAGSVTTHTRSPAGGSTLVSYPEAVLYRLTRLQRLSGAS
jgi:soluble lytic murein transglycosylase-like protein